MAASRPTTERDRDLQVGVRCNRNNTTSASTHRRGRAIASIDPDIACLLRSDLFRDQAEVLRHVPRTRAAAVRSKAAPLRRIKGASAHRLRERLQILHARVAHDRHDVETRSSSWAMPSCQSGTPVLPPVYSTTAPPGIRRPSRSGASIISSAIRSFMLPVGF